MLSSQPGHSKSRGSTLSHGDGGYARAAVGDGDRAALRSSVCHVELGGVAHTTLDSSCGSGRARAKNGRGGALGARASRGQRWERGARSALSGGHGGCCRQHCELDCACRVGLGLKALEGSLVIELVKKLQMLY
jgi:hypothetical protein